MTRNEKIKELLKNGHCNFDDPSDVNAMILFAYYAGLEHGTRETADQYKKVIYEMVDGQQERAQKCRYHKLAQTIIGDGFHNPYNPNYSADFTETFGNDEIDF